LLALIKDKEALLQAGLEGQFTWTSGDQEDVYLEAKHEGRARLWKIVIDINLSPPCSARYCAVLSVNPLSTLPTDCLPNVSLIWKDIVLHSCEFLSYKVVRKVCHSVCSALCKDGQRQCVWSPDPTEIDASVFANRCRCGSHQIVSCYW
jgi:hypothetical protein